MTPTIAPQKWSGPGALERTEAVNPKHRIRKSTALDTYRALAGQPSSRPIDALLARLDRVRQYGKGWRCDCPVGHSSRGTLSVAVGDDGRVLLKCFVGCSASEVLAALGMSIGDLFPERMHDTTPLGRAQRREAMQAANVAAAVAVLDREALVVLAAAGTLQRGSALTGADHDRLALAAQRVHDVREMFR